MATRFTVSDLEHKTIRRLYEAGYTDREIADTVNKRFGVQRTTYAISKFRHARGWYKESYRTRRDPARHQPVIPPPEIYIPVRYSTGDSLSRVINEIVTSGIGTREKDHWILYGRPVNAKDAFALADKLVRARGEPPINMPDSWRSP